MAFKSIIYEKLGIFWPLVPNLNILPKIHENVPLLFPLPPPCGILEEYIPLLLRIRDLTFSYINPVILIGHTNIVSLIS